MSKAENNIDTVPPADLSPRFFFDLTRFEHRAIFGDSSDFGWPGLQYVWEAIPRIGDYATQWLANKQPPRHLGSVSSEAYLSRPDEIFIGEGTVIEPGAYVAGPAIIGRNCVIRQGAYIRGDVILGDKVTIGHASEVKRAIFLNGAQAPHFAYVGDSILGNGVNLGAGTKLSNLPVNSVKNPVTGERPTIELRIGQAIYDTGLPKLGAILGDNVQTGCNCVLNPGCVVGPGTLIYANTSLRKGFFAAGKIIKLRQTIKIAELRAYDV